MQQITKYKTMSNNSTERAERIQNAVRIIRKVDSEAKRIQIIQELADKDGFDPEELLAELGKEARQRMKEEAEMPLPKLSPLLNAPY